MPATRPPLPQAFSVVHKGPHAPEIVGARDVVRARAPAAERLERQLTAARVAHRSLKSQVEELDCAGFHGRCDEMKTLKKRRLHEKDKIHCLVALLCDGGHRCKAKLDECAEEAAATTA